MDLSSRGRIFTSQLKINKNTDLGYRIRKVIDDAFERRS
jgi:hypothetical protein